MEIAKSLININEITINTSNENQINETFDQLFTIENINSLKLLAFETKSTSNIASTVESAEKIASVAIKYVTIHETIQEEDEF